MQEVPAPDVHGPRCVLDKGLRTDLSIMEHIFQIDLLRGMDSASAALDLLRGMDSLDLCCSFYALLRKSTEREGGRPKKRSMARARRSAGLSF